MYLTSISSYSHSFVACSGTLSAFQCARLLPLAVIIFSLLIEHQHQLKLGVVEGKTLSASKWTKWAGYGGACGNPSINSSIYDGIYYGPLPRRQISGKIAAKLSRDLIHVRLNIVHDKALEQEHSNKPGGLKGFIRDLIYSVQLIFERPEMSSSLKFNLVVTSIKLSSIDYPYDDTFLFRLSPDVISDGSTIDVNALLFYRTMGYYVGRAQKGGFCFRHHRYWYRNMILNCNYHAYVPAFAHELAHKLGVDHDGSGVEGVDPEYKCKNTNHIMSPEALTPEKSTWSKCTIEQLINVFTREDIAKCIYDPKRIASVKPLSDYFDFNPTTKAGRLNRKKLKKLRYHHQH